MRILFITSNRIGDAVLSTGILNHLINEYPDTKLTVACSSIVAPLFFSTPNIEEIIKIDKKPYSLHWIKLWYKVSNKYWDLIVDLRSSLISFILLTRRRTIFKKSRVLVHQVEALAKVLDVYPPPDPFIYVDETYQKKSEMLLNTNHQVLAIGAGANWGGKQWPIENFVELIDRLTSKGGCLEGSKVAILGSDVERSMISNLILQIPDSRCIDLLGKTDLLTAYACLKRCAAFVGNDSGLMHLAASSGIPTLGLFGPSREEVYGPWGNSSASIRTTRSFKEIVNSENYDYRSQKSHMLDLTVNRVEQEFIKLLYRSKNKCD